MSGGLVLVNGSATSVQAPRARALFAGFADIVFKARGRIGSVLPMAASLKQRNVSWIYCMDLGVPGAPLAAIRRSLGPEVKLIYEIGDPARPLLANQQRSRVEIALAHLFDSRLPWVADRLVVRGSYLVEYLQALRPDHELPPTRWIPDGADCELFRPRRNSAEMLELRRMHGLQDKFVVGLVGNIHFNPALRLFYGWELAEMLALVPADREIVGVVVGDGPGRDQLEASRSLLGLGDRLRLIGRVPHAQVPSWMNVFDLALSTQTNDPVGWSRTTAKLPEYLACGTPVICSDVGEAHRWLHVSGQTLPYEGMRDDSYPARLCSRVLELSQLDLQQLRDHNRALALRLFDYEVLRPQALDWVRSP